MICPICGSIALPANDQPQPSLHAYTTVFECGCKIDKAFGSGKDDWVYGQRCDEPIKRDIIDELFNPDDLKFIYAQQHIPSIMKRCIFLAGPTPRDKNTKSWRDEAKEIFEELDFKGRVFIPELDSEFICDNFEYKEQIEWEEKALNRAEIIIFWIPRELSHMPGFTTNVEWGYWVAKNPHKLVLGAPEDTPKMDYLKYYAEKLDIPSEKTLRDTINTAINKLNASRNE